MSLPLHLARALLADAAARRRYLWVAFLQSSVILGLALAFTSPVRERALQYWAALFASLQIAQWVVIALSRDYHDAISRDASLLSALEPEDEPLTPRIRLDVPWLRKKLSRRLRGLMVFLSGMPLIMMIATPFSDGGHLLAGLTSAWSAYWLVVFTAGKSARAWDDASPREPWFLRAWRFLTTRVPGFRWGLPRRYGLFWENRTRSVFPPAAAAEKLPWAFAGLAIIRALAMLPVVKCFLRPIIPVAAAHLLVAYRGAAPTAPSTVDGRQAFTSGVPAPSERG